MHINIKYFAALRDSTKVGNEKIETSAKTAEQLFDELNSKYAFNVSKKHIIVDINEEYSSFDSQIKPDDTIVFIPPVAGG